MRRVALVAAALVALVAPAAAGAHARLLVATPANGEILAAPPHVVVLRFDDPVATGPGVAAVDAWNRSILAGAARTKGTVQTIPLRPIGDGSYTVRWSVISDDGHTISGVLAFAVGAATPTATLAAGGNGPAPADVAGRWLLLAGALLAGGSALFLLLVARTRGVEWLATAGFAAAAAGALTEWVRVPSATRFAHALVVVIAAAVIGAAARRVPVLAVAAAAVLLAAISAGGHALDSGLPPVQAVVDFVHLAAAAAWAGGVAAVVIAGAHTNVRRFSRVAIVSVCVIAVTGLLRALSELTSVSQLVTTGYGRALVVKAVLFAALIALGALARVRLELALLVALVVAVAFLTSLAPGRVRGSLTAGEAGSGAPPPPPPDAVTAARPLGHRVLALAIRGAQGNLAVTASVIGGTGVGLDGLDVRIDGTATSRCGFGCYRATVPRTARVVVEVGGERRVFAVPRLPARSGMRFLSAVGARYLRARTAVFAERLSSGPGQVVTSTWRLAAPASLSFRASDGSAGVIIGGRRWDRDGAGRWVASPQSPRVPQPQLPWSAKPANVVLLPSLRVGGRELARVSFLDPATPAWFVVTADARTKELVRLEMVAPAHFMRDDYRGLDLPVRIRPPRR